MEQADPVHEGDPPPPELPCEVAELAINSLPTNKGLTYFWDAGRAWLSKRNVYLYPLVDCGHQTFRIRYWLCPPCNVSDSPPYSKCIPGPSYGPLLLEPMRFFAFAQDGAQRNLIIKIIEKGSSEYEINRSILEQQSTSSEKAAFPCVVVPVAVLDTHTDCSLLVMPMWGPYVHLTRMRRLREVVQFIKSTLRGLSYLHSLRIVHRDICDQNVVVNCHSPGATLEEFAEILDEHRQADDVTYAFIDFGQSLQLPLDTSITDCRRPGDETGIARNHFKPPDGHLGEPYYNPFSYDVAALGFLFRCYFSEAVPALPCLAALFDRMTDYCPSRRMTAQQALEWFEDIIRQLPQGCLEARVMLDRSFEAMRDEGLYWTKLSTEDQAKWGQYRTPPRPLWMRLLGFMSRNTLGFRILCFLRGHLQI